MATTKPGSRSRVAVLVNSCVGFVGTSWPALSRSLAEAGVDGGDVFVVAGDAVVPHPAAAWGVVERAHFAAVPWSNMDNNALIWAVSAEGRAALAEYDWVFMVHDTTLVTPYFAAELRCCEPKGLAGAQLCPWPSMSMGWYSLSALCSPSVAAWLLDSKEPDPGNRLAVKAAVEDSVFQRLRDAFGPASVGVLNPGGMVLLPGEGGYGGTARRRELAPVPGVIKRKANWNQEPMKLDL